MDTVAAASQKAAMMSLMRTACLAVLAVPMLVALLLASPARAHAILLDSDPAPRARLPPGPVVFRLHYNSRIDHARSRLTLIAADRTETRLPIGDASGADGITTALDAAPGAWTIRWQVLALDGHITRGDVPFAVLPKP